MRTLRVKELIKALKQYPQEYAVYLSTDSEGNSFGTLDTCMSISLNDTDRVVVLYPFEEHIDQEITEPLMCAQVERELIQEQLAREGKI